MKRLDFLHKARTKHGYKYDYVNLPDSLILNDTISIIYDGITYTQKVSKHLMGRCPEKNTQKKKNEEFISEAKKVWGNKYDYSITEYKGALKNIDVIFEGVKYTQRASSHLEGMSPEFRKNEESILREKIRNGDEYGKNEIEEFLIKYKVKYIRRYQIKTLEFDFYLPSHRFCIDFKGRQHFEPITELGGLETYNKILKDDNKKETYCEDNYIDFLIIKHTEFNNIYKILWDNLKEKLN